MDRQEARITYLISGSHPSMHDLKSGRQGKKSVNAIRRREPSIRAVHAATVVPYDGRNRVRVRNVKHEEDWTQIRPVVSQNAVVNAPAVVRSEGRRVATSSCHIQQFDAWTGLGSLTGCLRSGLCSYGRVPRRGSGTGWDRVQGPTQDIRTKRMLRTPTARTGLEAIRQDRVLG